MWFPPGLCEDCCLVTGWVPAWAGLALDHGGGARAKYRALSGSSEVKTGVSSTGFLGWQVCQACICDVVGAKYRTLQDLWGTAGSISCWVPVSGWLFTDCSWEGLEPSIGLFQTGVSPAGTLDPQGGWHTGYEGSGAEYRALSGSPRVQPQVAPSWSLSQQACLQTLTGRGLEPSIRPFQYPWGCRLDCLLHSPCAGKTMHHGWDGLEPSYRAFLESTNWVWWVYLQGLLDHGQ